MGYLDIRSKYIIYIFLVLFHWRIEEWSYRRSQWCCPYRYQPLPSVGPNSRFGCPAYSWRTRYRHAPAFRYLDDRIIGKLLKTLFRHHEELGTRMRNRWKLGNWFHLLKIDNVGFEFGFRIDNYCSWIWFGPAACEAICAICSRPSNHHQSNRDRWTHCWTLLQSAKVLNINYMIFS